MLTRCPHCRTAFRVTREQLLVRDGKVRCGACRRAFNAMGYLDHGAGHMPETVPVPAPPAASADDTLPEDTPLLETLMFPEKTAAGEEEDLFAGMLPVLPDIGADPAAASRETRHVSLPGSIDELQASSAAHRPDPIDELLARENTDDAPMREDDEETEAAGVSRWSDTPPETIADAAAYPLWPFVLVSSLLAFLLFFQAAYHYRGELGRQSPVALRIFSAFNIRVPLAREAEWLSIDASDLSPMTRPGHFQLTATLRNQFRYPQDWPQLEISLTDSYYNILARRVFSAAEYLPADAPPAFAPGDTSLRLELEAGDLNPSGYRLYLFYF